jgi:hypothetical protein
VRVLLPRSHRAPDAVRTLSGFKVVFQRRQRLARLDLAISCVTSIPSGIRARSRGGRPLSHARKPRRERALSTRLCKGTRIADELLSNPGVIINRMNEPERRSRRQYTTGRPWLDVLLAWSAILSCMSMGKRKRDRQPAMWLATTDLPTGASHPFYRRLNRGPVKPRRRVSR